MQERKRKHAMDGAIGHAIGHAIKRELKRATKHKNRRKQIKRLVKRWVRTITRVHKKKHSKVEKSRGAAKNHYIHGVAATHCIHVGVADLRMYGVAADL